MTRTAATRLPSRGPNDFVGDCVVLFPEWPEVWSQCCRRLRRWCVPPNWSAADWFDEIQAHSLSAACQALHDYDPTRGVPLSAFVRQRILAAALTRCRQEWAYALHCCGSAILVEEFESPPAPDPMTPSLQDVLFRLTNQDYWLLQYLYWEGWTETRIAKQLGISQQAVSKRKQSILLDLERLIRVSGQ